MWTWLTRGEKRPPEAELKGAPAHPRKKTYSAETGYVYQYLYKGFRIATSGVQFVFEATQGRAEFQITVLLTNTALAECETVVGREILHQEHYAIVKMAIFAAFNRVADPSAFHWELAPDQDAILAHLKTLDRI